MKKTDESKNGNLSKNDMVLTNMPTTQSRGISTSSNITVDSAGAGDGSDSLFPETHKNKNWSSKTTMPVNDGKLH